MILGERIKGIRTFRGLTQRELGLKLGYEERNADVRVAQYKSSYLVSKRHSHGNCQEFKCQLYQFYYRIPGYAEDIMQTFFWLDEDSRNTFHLFQLSAIPASATLLMIRLFAIMIVTNGLLMPLLVCGLIMVW